MQITDEANQKDTNGSKDQVEVVNFSIYSEYFANQNLTFDFWHDTPLPEMISKDISGYVDNKEIFSALVLIRLILHSPFNVK